MNNSNQSLRPSSDCGRFTMENNGPRSVERLSIQAALGEQSLNIETDPSLSRLARLLTFLFALYILLPAALDEPGEMIMNAIGPIVILGACLTTAYKLISNMHLAVWT